MMSRLLTLIAVLALLPLGLSAQMDKYCSDYSFAQREGTEDVAREYFSHIATRSDTIYVLLYTPAWSPRLETPLPSFRSQLRRADPDAELVLLSVGRTADVAKKHNKRMGYAADYYMYDDVDAYRSFLSIETGYPIGSLVMKVDKASGRVLWSGCPIYFIPEFFADLVNVSDPQPFMSYASDLTGGEFPLPADLRDADLSYLAYELHTDDSLFAMIHTERLPVLRGGMLVHADEFCPGFSCFRYDSVYGRFEFVKSLEPVGDERYAYVRLPEDEWQKPYVRNLLLYPKLSPMFLPDGNLGLGYDLPEVIRIDSTNIGQSNFPAILVRDARTLEPLPMIRLSDDFFDDLNDYLYKFYNLDVIDDERMILGLSVMGYPIDGYEEFTGDPARDPFVDAFYDDGKPYLQLVDKRRLLPELFAGDELACFDSEAELYQKIDYFLAHPEERAQYCRRARERVLAEHTYARRMQQLLDYVAGQFGPWKAEAGQAPIAQPLLELLQRLELGPGASFENVVHMLRQQSGTLNDVETAILFLDEWRRQYRGG